MHLINTPFTYNIIEGMKLIRFFGFGIIFGLLGLVGCNNNQTQEVIPYAYVELILNIDEPSSFELQPIGGYIYHPGGSNGLIIYHADLDVFRVYDRHSTYNVNSYCQVSVDPAGFKLIDDCGTSEFSLFDGSVLKGPAQHPLKQYRVTFDGTFISIRN